MKRKTVFALISVAAFIVFAALSPSSQNNPKLTDPPQEKAPDLGFPADVQDVIMKSCYGCHNDDAKSVKAKMKLNFSKWDGLKDTKKIKKLDNICKTMEERDMPPKKFLNKYPDRKLSDEEIKLVCKWVDDEINKIMGE